MRAILLVLAAAVSVIVGAASQSCPAISGAPPGVKLPGAPTSIRIQQRWANHPHESDGTYDWGFSLCGQVYWFNWGPGFLAVECCANRLFQNAPTAGWHWNGTAALALFSQPNEAGGYREAYVAVSCLPNASSLVSLTDVYLSANESVSHFNLGHRDLCTAATPAPLVPPPPPSPPGSTCNLYSDCESCTNAPSGTCGWCTSDKRCVPGTAAGPTNATCAFPGHWEWVTGNCVNSRRMRRRA